MLGLQWHKARASNGANTGCVEACQLIDSAVLVRDSKNPLDGFLEFTPHEWRLFLGAVRAGEFDID